MSNEVLDLKKLEEAGEALGRAYAAMLKSFIRGFKEAGKTEEAKETQEDETPKDCCNCWCNECAEQILCVIERGIKMFNYYEEYLREPNEIY